MTVGAVVTAAGLSSRMGCFKPLLKIGGIPAAERIISNIHTVGIKDIALVTGHNAGELENSLNDTCAVFLRNERYAHTEMFDSMKIGLEYLKDKCDRILFTPVDVPLFTPETVRLLLKSEASVVIPIFNQKKGHPVVLEKSAVNEILGYTGSGGLKGAIENLLLKVEHVEVRDGGVIYDMDTREDYNKIIKMRSI